MQVMSRRPTRPVPQLRAPFVLRDHDRLPGRFFGRMTGSIQAFL
jgi:hypothetical protein